MFSWFPPFPLILTTFPTPLLWGSLSSEGKDFVTAVNEVGSLLPQCGNFFVARIQHHDWPRQLLEEFIVVYGSEGEMVEYGGGERHGSKGPEQEAERSISNDKHKAEGMNGSGRRL